MTNLSEVRELLLARIPLEMREDNIADEDVARLGIINMSSALDLDLVFTKKEMVDEFGEPILDEDGNVKMQIVGIEQDLSIKELNLASYFAYGVYLEKLKLILTNDAINFSTLTFSIKGLEKRPEMINDSIYQNKRYLEQEIARAQGASSVLGTAKQFGG